MSGPTCTDERGIEIRALPGDCATLRWPIPRPTGRTVRMHAASVLALAGLLAPCAFIGMSTWSPHAAAQPAPVPSAGAASGSSAAESEAARTETLERLLTEFQKKDSDTLRFLQALAKKHEADEEYDSAATVYAHLAAVFPDDSYWTFKTAQMHAFAGDLDEAVVLSRALRERAPDDFDAGLLLARVYAWNGQWSQSEQVIIELEDQYPNAPALMKTRGDLLYYQGRFSEAKLRYQKYLERRSQDPEALQALARCYLALGEKERAEELRAPLQEAGNEEAVRQIEQSDAGVDHPFRFDLAPSYSFNAERPDWFGVRSTLTYQFHDAVTLGAGFDLASRRDIDSTNVMILVLGGFKLGDRVTLETELGFTPSSDFRPQFMGRLIPRVKIVDWFDFFVFYQFMMFDQGAGPDNDLLVNQVGPGLGFHFGPVSLDLAYRATFFDESELEVGHLGVLDLRAKVHPRWALLGSAAYGDNTEVFYDPNPVIRDTLTLVGGIEFGITEWQGIRGIYSFFTTDPPREDPGGLYSHTATLHYWVRF